MQAKCLRLQVVFGLIIGNYYFSKCMGWSGIYNSFFNVFKTKVGLKPKMKIGMHIVELTLAAESPLYKSYL